MLMLRLVNVELRLMDSVFLNSFTLQAPGCADRPLFYRDTPDQRVN